MNEIDIRWQFFQELAPYFGRVVSANFIQKTSNYVAEIERVHNLIEGIYKPRGASYSLSIASMLKNPYADRISYHRDRTWYFYYSPKSGSLDSAVNSSYNPPFIVAVLSSNSARISKYLVGLLQYGIVGVVERFTKSRHRKRSLEAISL